MTQGPSPSIVPRTNRTAWAAWLPALLWMALIFIGSTNLLSGNNTSRFLGPLIRWFVPGISEEGLRTTQALVRKCGHLAEYAILAVLYLRALRKTSEKSAATPRSFWVALVLAALYAASDELHQGWESNRDGRVTDVFIDTFGAALGLGAVWLIEQRRRRRE